MLVEKAPGVDGRTDEDEAEVEDDADAAGGLEGPGCALMGSGPVLVSSRASRGW